MTKPVRMAAGLQAQPQSSWQGDLGVPGVYYKTGSGWTQRNPDNSEALFGSGGGGGGGTIDGPHAATLQNSCTNLGGAFQTAEYTKDTNGFVHLDGVLNGVGTGVVVLTLPTGFRPAAKQIFVVLASNSGAAIPGRFDVDTDGTVTCRSSAGDFISLSGISFLAAGVSGTGTGGTVTGPTAITLQNSCTNLGSPFQTAQYSKDSSGFVHIEGALNPVGLNVVMFTLPAGFRPGATQICVVLASNSGSAIPGRIDIAPDGTATCKSGSGDFISLSGISFLAAA